VVSSWRRVWEPEQRGEGNILCTGNPSAPFDHLLKRKKK